jgi:hypothetical protein
MRDWIPEHRGYSSWRRSCAPALSLGRAGDRSSSCSLTDETRSRSCFGMRLPKSSKIVSRKHDATFGVALLIERLSVQFELMDRAQKTMCALLERRGFNLNSFVLPRHNDYMAHISTDYALVSLYWVSASALRLRPTCRSVRAWSCQDRQHGLLRQCECGGRLRASGAI